MLKHMKRQRQAGDTLIEVLFAVTVFSLVVVTSLSIMNQGTSASLRSLQITLVRQEMDNQAETLRFLNSAYVAAYYKGYAPTVVSPAQQYYRIKEDIKNAGEQSVSAFGSSTKNCEVAPSDSFILNTRSSQYLKGAAANMDIAEGYSQVIYNASNTVTKSRGIWIEGVRSTPSDGSSYTDFHIRACWSAPGTGQAMNLGTIVRLYEPAD